MNPPNMPQDKLIAVKKLAKELGCHPETVLRMLRAGKIPGMKIGRSWRIDPQAALLALSNGPIKR